jgi:hypothetical protein
MIYEARTTSTLVLTTSVLGADDECGAELMMTG